MALVIDLKPGEKILIGTAVITNDKQRTRIHVIQEDEADTPCKKIYFLIQCMYLARNPREYHAKYFAILKDILQAAPSTAPAFAEINEYIIKGHYYKALKEGRGLIDLEEEILKRA